MGSFEVFDPEHGSKASHKDQPTIVQAKYSIHRPNATVGAPYCALSTLIDPFPPAPAATYSGIK